MVARRRWCPLCDRELGEEACATHGVPTVDPDRLTTSDGTPLTTRTVLGGRFALEQPLGEGGMGVTFVARDRERGDVCVVKLTKTGPGTLDRVRRMFQEARALKKLEHPRVARLIAFDVDPALGVPFLAIELARGRPLDQLIRRTGPLPEQRAAGLLAEVALALDHAHEHGVLHRDLKPSNVIVEEGEVEHARVLDFGLAKIAGDGDERPLTAPGAAVGTPWYMSPEQILGGAVDARSDVYALGCLLHAALTGKPPHDHRDMLEVMKLQLRGQQPSLPSVLADGRAPSAALVALHRAMLEKSRFDRPASAAIVAEQLAAIARGTPIADATTDRDSPRHLLRVPARSPIPAAETIPKADLDAHGTKTAATIVAPRPLDASDSATGSEPGLLVYPSPAPLRARTLRAAWLAIPAIAVAIAVAGFAIRPRPSTEPTGSPKPAAIAEQRPSVVARERSVAIVSAPAGAVVREGKRVLGTTPLELPARPVHLIVELGGYVSASLELNAQSPERIEVQLQREKEKPKPKDPPPAKPKPQDDVKLPLW